MLGPETWSVSLLDVIQWRSSKLRIDELRACWIPIWAAECIWHPWPTNSPQQISQLNNQISQCFLWFSKKQGRGGALGDRGCPRSLPTFPEDYRKGRVGKMDPNVYKIIFPQPFVLTHPISLSKPQSRRQMWATSGPPLSRQQVALGSHWRKEAAGVQNKKWRTHIFTELSPVLSVFPTPAPSHSWTRVRQTAALLKPSMTISFLGFQPKAQGSCTSCHQVMNRE